MVRVTTPRHIVFVTDAFWPEVGGVERVCLELARALVRRRVRVTVIARRVDGRPDDEVREGVRICRYAPAIRPTPWVWATTAWSAARRLVDLALTDRPDLVHFHLSLSAQGPLSILRKRGIPIFSSFYGRWDREFAAELDDRRWSTSRRWSFAAQMRAQRAMQRRLLDRSDRVVVLSDFSRSEALSLAPAIAYKIRKIPGGVDPIPFHSRGEAAETERPRTILTVRRLVRRMGVDLLIAALPSIARSFTDVRLIIGGRGPLESSLFAATRANSVEDRVEFRGYVDDANLSSLYRECDVFVLPTRAQENFGLPALEAAACGADVVATHVGSLPEVVRLAGSRNACVEPSVEAIAAAVKSALGQARDPDEIRRRHLEAERVRRELSWDAIAERYLDIYEETRACAWR